MKTIQISKLEVQSIFKFFYQRKSKQSIIHIHKIESKYLNKIINQFQNKFF